jgi:hypothetical protein
MKQKVIPKFSIGTFIPTRRSQWQSAADKLQEANDAIDEMTAAADRVSFENAWTDFIDALQLFWERFRRGGTFSVKVRGYIGHIKCERAKDDLLSYLYQARHIYQHGAIPLDWEELTTSLGRGFNGHIQTVAQNSDGSFDVESEPLPGANAAFNIDIDGGRPVLAILNNEKYNQKFHPPESHLGNLLTDVSPITAAKMGHSYCENVLVDAIKRFGSIKS